MQTKKDHGLESNPGDTVVLTKQNENSPYFTKANIFFASLVSAYMTLFQTNLVTDYLTWLCRKKMGFLLVV